MVKGGEWICGRVVEEKEKKKQKSERKPGTGDDGRNEGGLVLMAWDTRHPLVFFRVGAPEAKKVKGGQRSLTVTQGTVRTPGQKKVLYPQWGLGGLYMYLPSPAGPDQTGLDPPTWVVRRPGERYRYRTRVTVQELPFWRTTLNPGQGRATRRGLSTGRTWISPPARPLLI